MIELRIVEHELGERMMKEEFYILMFAIIMTISVIILHNHKKSECEKSGGMLYSEMVGKTTLLRCSHDK